MIFVDTNDWNGSLHYHHCEGIVDCKGSVYDRKSIVRYLTSTRRHQLRIWEAWCAEVLERRIRVCIFSLELDDVTSKSADSLNNIFDERYYYFYHNHNVLNMALRWCLPHHILLQFYYDLTCILRWFSIRFFVLLTSIPSVWYLFSCIPHNEYSPHSEYVTHPCHLIGGRTQRIFVGLDFLHLFKNCLKKTCDVVIVDCGVVVTTDW